jgi:Fic family protein
MSGIFTFQIGVDMGELQPLLDRVIYAKERFCTIPLFADLINKLANQVVVSSIHGTNTIEGGTLSIEETEKALGLSPDQIKTEEERRAVNLGRAYKGAEKYATGGKPQSGGMVLFEVMFTDLHLLITSGLTHKKNVPGKYRNDQKGEAVTSVGNESHGGVYIPPKPLMDIELLINKFLEWINSKELLSISPLIRAPLAHYYFEMIHPFADGNGRVGRIIEAMILRRAKYKYASSSMATYYQANIDDYFMAFNLARKMADKKEQHPNTRFVELFLTGMLAVIEHNHDAVHKLMAPIVMEVAIKNNYDAKRINQRQYIILTQLLAKEESSAELKAFTAEPWYEGLYKKLTSATRYRDLRQLRENKVITFSDDGTISLILPTAGS